jgi:hypothetical protein
VAPPRSSPHGRLSPRRLHCHPPHPNGELRATDTHPSSAYPHLNYPQPECTAPDQHWRRVPRRCGCRAHSHGDRRSSDLGWRDSTLMRAGSVHGGDGEKGRRRSLPAATVDPSPDSYTRVVQETPSTLEHAPPPIKNPWPELCSHEMEVSTLLVQLFLRTHRPPASVVSYSNPVHSSRRGRSVL